MKTSLLWRRLYLEQGQSVYSAHQFSFMTRQVLNKITKYEKNEQVQQANLFNIKHTIQSRLNINPICQQVFDWLVQKMMLAAARLFLLSNTFSTISKFLTPNMHWRSCRTLLTIHWTHLRVNGICTKSFCPQKMNNRMLFLTGFFYQQCHYI